MPPPLLDRIATAERAALAEEIAALIRHDIRNKLTSIRNAAFYIAQRVRDTDAWRSDARIATFFGLIDEQAEAAEGVLVDRVKLGHLFASQASPMLMRTLVEHVLAIWPPSPAIHVERRFEDRRNLRIAEEEGLLMIRCLVDNAIEALVDGGSLSLSTRDADGWVSLEVRDSGPGFGTTSSAAFEPFQTRKRGHLGLGLNIAQRIAHRYGGGITIGAEARGASVTASIPIPDPALAT